MFSDWVIHFFFFIKKMETSLFLYDKKKQYKYAKKKEG